MVLKPKLIILDRVSGTQSKETYPYDTAGTEDDLVHHATGSRFDKCQFQRTRDPLVKLLTDNNITRFWLERKIGAPNVMSSFRTVGLALDFCVGGTVSLS